MPTVQANGIDIYYEVQGEGEPLVLIPYLAADQACYAFQVAEYAKHFTCYTVDLRGAGLSGKPEGTYTHRAVRRRRGGVHAGGRASASAHVSGLSLGAATGMWLAAKYPALVKSLSLHSAWPATDPYLRTVVRGLADHGEGAGQRHRHGDQGDLPLVLHPGAVRGAARVHRLARRLRPRPADAAGRRLPAAVGGGARARRAAVLGLDPGADADHVRPARRGDVDPVRRAAHRRGSRDSEVVIFEDCAHAPIYENVEEFNSRTLAFLKRHTG